MCRTTSRSIPLATDTNYLSGLGCSQLCDYLRHKLNDIGESIRVSAKNDYSKGKAGNVLLVGKIAVHGDEDVNQSRSSA
jgi:hypothetical protein